MVIVDKHWASLLIKGNCKKLGSVQEIEVLVEYKKIYGESHPEKYSINPETQFRVFKRKCSLKNKNNDFWRNYEN